MDVEGGDGGYGEMDLGADLGYDAGLGADGLPYDDDDEIQIDGEGDEGEGGAEGAEPNWPLAQLNTEQDIVPQPDPRTEEEQRRHRHVAEHIKLMPAGRNLAANPRQFPICSV